MAKLKLKEIFMPALIVAAIFCILYPMAFASASRNEEDLLFIKYHIHIYNDMPDDQPPGVPSLFLHCKSKDVDLGQRRLLLHEDYHWDSQINDFRTTLFFCFAWWEGKSRYFDAFKATRDEHRCRLYHNSCLWSVRKDGIYFSNNNSTWFNAYPW